MNKTISDLIKLGETTNKTTNKMSGQIVADVSGKNIADVSGKNIGKVSGKIMAEISEKLVNIFKKNPTITIPELSQRLGFHERTIYRYVRRLKQDKILFRVGTDKKGYWEIIEND